VVACKKESFVNSNKTATIQVVNGIIKEDVQLKMNGKLNTSGANSSNSQQSTISFGTGTLFYTEGKSTSIEFLKNNSTDSLFSNTYDFKDGGIYTLLLAGVSPNVETVLIDDTNFLKIDLSKIPNDADSVINIRFINLCPDAQPLTIRQAGDSTNEASGLAYKGYTSFKAYSAKVTDYFGTVGYSILSFEIVENGTILQTYSMFVYDPYNRFKNVGLVITGKKTPELGQPGLAVSEVDYYQ
jgi:hypothetical protein